MGGGLKRFLPVIGSTRLVMLFALVLVVFYNAATWKALHGLVPLQGLKGFAFFASFAVFLWAAFTLLLTLVSFRPLLKPVLTLVALCSAGATYFMGSYGISIDTVMVQNVFETNATEAGDLVNPTLLGYLLLFGVLPSLLVWLWPVRYRSFFRGLLNKILTIAGCLLIVAVMVGSFYSTYAPIFREEDKLTHFINPTNYIYAVGKYAKQRLVIKEHLVVEPIGLDARQAPAALQREKKSLLVFVVGETARADHFSLNGYARETNPELKKQDILNFTQVHSCGTSTAVSVPCMFSQYPREDYSDKKAKTHEGLLDILQRAGVQVLWLENNSDCKGTCLRVPNRDIPKTQPSPFLRRQELPGRVAAGGPAGVHRRAEGQRHHRSAFRWQPRPGVLRALPEGDGALPAGMPDQPARQLQQGGTGQCLRQHHPLYDHFLSQVIELLKRNADKRDTAMIYVSRPWRIAGRERRLPARRALFDSAPGADPRADGHVVRPAGVGQLGNPAQLPGRQA
ncbi:membrane-associated, metal-dependent hydrolase [Pseudomonas aeruginosa]|nr:membrane-associated, metal-dependent hydrolase [Pseudomonas aeruginosa]